MKLYALDEQGTAVHETESETLAEATERMIAYFKANPQEAAKVVSLLIDSEASRKAGFFDSIK